MVKVNLKPTAGYVLIKPAEAIKKTASGIVLPESHDEKPQKGKVVAVGPGKLDDDGKRIPLEVKKEDRVLFGKYAGTEIKIDGVEHLIMREDDILGIIKK